MKHVGQESLFVGGIQTTSWECYEGFIFLGAGANLNLVEIQLIEIKAYFLRMKNKEIAFQEILWISEGRKTR